MELSQQFDVHANQIKQWKDQLLEGATGVFGDEAKAEPAGPTVDVKTLHAKIGELTLENDFCPVRSARRDCWAERNDRPRTQTVGRAPGEASRLQPWQRLLFSTSSVGWRSCSDAPI
ncbi:putative insertion sequence transposase protein, IS3 family (plasmid) [Rhizobium etli CFN 42]|uniref:Insertion sequence transposase protein, IS3 family n=1 Tax=Rhizobium etli (strain ATCC 51251 / DSM 11541 / JCM 21823 / NBRC 15573 / CFN 42) TaxID=347834 RepID=Q2K2F9_RHIEC|nr:putative insertion sequence transposase protein, IS3 family [Rhizobium etli CFN 42]